MQQVTKLDPETGIFTDMQDNVLGYKCLACSTAHVLEPQDDPVEVISMWMETHANC
jgi:antitoxin component HigA of HigAB toxin-antitoxin module